MERILCEAGGGHPVLPDIEDWREYWELPFFIDPCQDCQLTGHLEALRAIREKTANSTDLQSVERHRVTIKTKNGSTNINCKCECTTENR